jgi:hypothetical protein
MADYKGYDSKVDYDDYKDGVYEDDGSMIVINEQQSHKEEFPSHSSPHKMVALDLSFATADDKHSRHRPKASSIDEPDIQERDLNIVFDLPDGSQSENFFKLGHTVEFLKSYVESEYGIPMTEQTLFLDDKVLFDPYSLLDYPEVKGKPSTLLVPPNSLLTIISPTRL